MSKELIFNYRGAVDVSVVNSMLKAQYFLSTLNDESLHFYGCKQMSFGLVTKTVMRN